MRLIVFIQFYCSFFLKKSVHLTSFSFYNPNKVISFNSPRQNEIIHCSSIKTETHLWLSQWLSTFKVLNFKLPHKSKMFIYWNRLFQPIQWAAFTYISPELFIIISILLSFFVVVVVPVFPFSITLSCASSQQSRDVLFSVFVNTKKPFRPFLASKCAHTILWSEMDGNFKA